MAKGPTTDCTTDACPETGENVSILLLICECTLPHSCHQELTPWSLESISSPECGVVTLHSINIAADDEPEQRPLSP